MAKMINCGSHVFSLQYIVSRHVLYHVDRNSGSQSACLPPPTFGQWQGSREPHWCYRVLALLRKPPPLERHYLMVSNVGDETQR